ncbi:MAG: ABC transporter ATP-binding protein [Nitrospinaceae bacterium]|jgi:iron(III) transport system ATP-binding protein|nr:ABC transporter ATP-binding protein [Nitrospinaceae bacterium]MBT3432741.1 ABC transporter ATP-binding protein [Nitrospinaceae bacterium]MBT3821537.1 ABC transporter ATP-binding protein [Nitrospinaceae bacterium]MBT4094444.1 ABC transporter ATP-binding protein [Nitrospinaceae bacterium]MBT4429836.1 ABC transporter ATP-binding protein [Nitrospinaceae bacterium]
MQITVTNLSKTFESMDGPVAALQDVSFTINRGEFYTLLGPSGCGKSTTLRCIAGLESPDSGEIRIGEQVVVAPGVSVPPNERPIGMVFQSYAIWPHMTVFNNVAFPLKQGKRKVPRAEREKRVMEVLSLMQMEDLAHRPAPNLSGGQQQRVALARALVSSSEVLLLDEPLSNLDAKLREDLRLEIKDLTRELGITAIYVTHDQLEALAMSDRIAVMLNGKIVQEATPRELYLKPKTSFVAQFVGQVNFFDGTVREDSSDGHGLIETALGAWRCPIPSGITKGAKAKLAVRPEGLRLSSGGEDKEGNLLEGRVEKTVFLGETIECQILVGSQTITTKISIENEVAEGDKIFLKFAPENCLVLPAESL